MLTILSDVPLQTLNTFGLDSTADFFTVARDIDELGEALEWACRKGHPAILLGGGSNVILRKRLQALVIQIKLTGVAILSDNGETALVSAAAGEMWHDFVRWTLAQGLGGLENLSLIPGTVGAAPVQNIGAYGASLSDTCVAVTALHRTTRRVRELTAQECAFGYRDSLFKREPNQWAVLSATFELHRHHTPRADYGSLQSMLDPAAPLTCSAVSDAVCSVRRAKLPDPAILGNAGSFFKNPQVNHAVFNALRATYPEMPAFPQPDGSVKLSAGWLIEHAGWRGKDLGPAGSYEKQALVLVNRNGATAEDILRLAHAIGNDVQTRFGVELQMEPAIY